MKKRMRKHSDLQEESSAPYAVNGIDISSHQGKVDFSRLRNSGISFVILRCGYGKDMESQDDFYFERNVSECEKYRIPWGTYFYSYAVNMTEAEDELRHILRLLQEKKPLYPVFIDMEDADEYKKKRNVSEQLCAEICTFLCAGLERAGYCTGIYANLHWLTCQINNPDVEKFDKWLVQWAAEPTYAKPFQIWQYSNRGKIDGISGWVNLDCCYKNYPDLIRQAGRNGYPKRMHDSDNAAFPFKVGDVVRVRRRARNSKGQKMSRTMRKGRYVIDSIKENMARLDRQGINMDFYITDLLLTADKQGTSFRWYTVKRGETLRKIALEQMGSGLLLFRLSRYNGLRCRSRLVPGQQLKIPKH